MSHSVTKHNVYIIYLDEKVVFEDMHSTVGDRSNIANLSSKVLLLQNPP